MVAVARSITILVVCLTAAGGCALWNQPPPAKPPLSPEQAQWWQDNRHRARYVKSKGYYVEGTSGFFDHEGHKVSSELGGIVEQDKPGLLEGLAPKTAWKNMKKAVGQGPNEKIARQSLAEGDDLFRQKKFVEAAKAYRKAYKRWPDSPLEEEALFKAGESEFFADRYDEAEDEYALLVKKFNSTQYLSQLIERRFAIGRYWEEFDRAHPRFVLNPNLFDKTRPMFDTGGHAVKVYERIRLDDPIGPRADDSVMATANYYFLKGRWDDADYHYGLLRSEFPRSEHQFQAHLLGLRCKLLRYQGPGYDGTQLDEAEDLATQLLTQFSRELAEERERVVLVRADVRSQRALRQWEMAEFYAKNDYYRAARHYFTKVVNDYPDTKLAAESRKRLEEFEGKPDNPEPPFDWLVNWLPRSNKEGPAIPKDFQKDAQNVAERSDGTTLR
ncbi:MAG: tetratricopeptide repeat protein [Pirellulales bacterium]